MLSVLIDTSVWLDLAKRRDGQQTIVPMRLLMHWNRLELLVPSLILEEFERNRPRAEAAATTSVRERFRLLRKDVQDYGGDATLQWLDEMTHQVPYVSARSLQNFSEIADLLRGGHRLEPGPEEYRAVVERSLEKKAPFHLHKNSVADALLIELYKSIVSQSDDSTHRFCFVTSNYQDFSLPNGDRRQPHPDLAPLFDGERSRYFYEVDGLNTALLEHFGDEFTREAEEVEAVQSEPRSFGEIVDAHQEYFDRTWYVRRVMHDLDVAEGTQELHPNIVERVRTSMRAIEERYGKDNLLPADEWEWGYIQGKLSALRWVLGDEWDFLDT